MAEKTRRGGARPNSGRRKRDSNTWGQITCILRKETIAKLREGCGGAQKHFGPFLQDHLDRYPLPDRETYQYWKKMKELKDGSQRAAAMSQWDKHVRSLRRAERERLKAERWAKANPEAAKREAKIEKLLLRVRKQQLKDEAKAAKEAASAAKVAA